MDLHAVAFPSAVVFLLSPEFDEEVLVSFLYLFALSLSLLLFLSLSLPCSLRMRAGAEAAHGVRRPRDGRAGAEGAARSSRRACARW